MVTTKFLILLLAATVTNMTFLITLEGTSYPNSTNTAQDSNDLITISEGFSKTRKLKPQPIETEMETEEEFSNISVAFLPTSVLVSLCKPNPDIDGIDFSVIIPILITLVLMIIVVVAGIVVVFWLKNTVNSKDPFATSSKGSGRNCAVGEKISIY